MSTLSRFGLPALAGLLTLAGLGSLLAAVLWSPPEPAPAVEPAAPSARPIPSIGAPTTSPSPAASGSPVVEAAPVPVAGLADPEWVARTAAAGQIPERALAAYAGAALWMKASQPSCGIGWNTLAAIGLVESEHGTMGGSEIGHDGVAAPPIIGVPLNGQDGVGKIADTDGGRLDGDATWDRAVGPMQFIPSSWEKLSQDGSLDGQADIHNIDDAALTAAVHLCEVGGDLTVAKNWIAAIAAYNNDVDYNNRVAEAADRYASLNS